MQLRTQQGKNGDVATIAEETLAEIQDLRCSTPPTFTSNPLCTPSYLIGFARLTGIIDIKTYGGQQNQGRRNSRITKERILQKS